MISIDTDRVHEDFGKALKMSLEREGYVSVLGLVQKAGNKSELVAEIPSKDEKYILSNKKSDLKAIYSLGGFRKFVLEKAVSSTKRQYKIYSGFDGRKSKKSKAKNPDETLYCILYLDTEIEFYPVCSIDSYLKRVYETIGEIEEQGMSQYYRGQMANWSIVPSLFRKPKWVEEEAKLNAKICSDRPTDFLDCKTQFERLVRLKHYNQPSRLLDLTKNPLIGLFFANEYAEKHPNQFGAVHCCFSDESEEKYASLSDSVQMLTAITQSIFRCKYPRYDKKEICEHYKNLRRLGSGKAFCEDDCPYMGEIAYQFEKETSIEFDDMTPGKLNTVLIVKPPLNNHRIIQQQGLFIMCGRNKDHPYDAPESLDELFRIDNKRRIFLIHPKDVKMIKNQLDVLGIDEYYIYGDLEREIKVEQKRMLKEDCAEGAHND